MTGLPSTGANYATVIEPSLNPLGVRYGQIVDVFIRDYLNENGSPNNLAAASCGLGSEGVFTPFAADGVSIREDLLWDSESGTNQGWFHIGLLKEDAQSVSPDQTVQQTPSSQVIRTVRNVFTKLEDKITFTPIEASDLVNRLRFELPLNSAGWTPTDGTPGYQLVRPATDVLIERQIIMFLIDTDGQLVSEVFPRVASDKKGKVGFERKNPYSLELSYDVLPDPFTQSAGWINRAGTAWNAEGLFNFESVPPIVTPITGLKATVVVPTPLELTTPTYTVALQTTAGGSFTAGTVTTPAPSSSGGFTTITIGSLAASQQYNGLQITVSGTSDGGTVTATSPVSAPFTATAS
jgi:hypothetical protein